MGSISLSHVEIGSINLSLTIEGKIMSHKLCPGDFLLHEGLIIYIKRSEQNVTVHCLDNSGEIRFFMCSPGFAFEGIHIRYEGDRRICEEVDP
jgi:hypothetical protein